MSAFREPDMRTLFEIAADDYPMPELAPDEIIIDLFAGGGGASLGIEEGTGRSPDEAVNHSPAAIAIHALNHPKTRHHPIDIWKADPITVAAGRPVGLLWASPDCTHHSRAKGGKPVSKKLRCLAHVVVRYADKVRPRVIMLENVPEFLQWGPISRATGRPDPKRKGHSFRTWKRQLERLGYVVEYRKLRGMFYGAPTSRERLFLVARCDGAPIRWPEPSHGFTRLLPVRTAAECLDFSLPCPSIFLTKEEAKAEGRRIGRRIIRPLAPPTLRRIARGVMKYVVKSADPFIIPIDHQSSGASGARSVHEPLSTITTEPRHALIVPTLYQAGYGERDGQAPRSLDIQQPIGTIVAGGGKHGLATAFLAKHYSERGDQVMASDLRTPIGTITAVDHHALVMGFLSVYYGNEEAGQSLREAMRTITPHDRMALVIVHISTGEYRGTYILGDIGQRMLTAREQANGQGFPPSYILDGFFINEKGKRRRITETHQKSMVGNSVNPQIPAALCRANFGRSALRREVAA